MDKHQLIERNKRFVFAVLNLIENLPNTRISEPLIRQLVRCSTSVGANYRAACRAKSTADFINKLKIVEEEADEANYFLDLLLVMDKGTNRDRIQKILKESNELVANYSAALKTVKAPQNPPSQIPK